MKRRILIYQRIIIIQFISILIICIIFGIFSYSCNRSKEINDLIIQTDQLKERLASNLSVPLWNFDTNNYEKILMKEIRDKYIYALAIYQENKYLIGKIKSDKGEITNTDDISKDAEVLKKTYAVKKAKIIYRDNEEDKEIGEVVLYITGKSISESLSGFLWQTIFQTLLLVIILSIITFIILNIFLDTPLKRITETAVRIAGGEMDLKVDESSRTEISTLAKAFNSMTEQLENKAEGFRKTNGILMEIIEKAEEIIVNLNSSSKEIEAAAQEQTSGASEQASGITEVSATLEELTITAKQITKNVGELVYSSEEVMKLLNESEKHLLSTVSELEEVGKISTNNTSEIGELGKRSVIINEMVELIKEVANKTDMLSINASIEAAKSKGSGAGFSVVATEIRELSKETISSAKNVEKAAKEIQSFIKSIIASSESESKKVVESGKVVKSIFDNVGTITGKINNNYSFTQKIDVSIKQQETGSRQAADTMKQMSEIARQSAETARQTLVAVKDIVNFSSELNSVVDKFKSGNISEENKDDKKIEKINSDEMRKTEQVLATAIKPTISGNSVHITKEIFNGLIYIVKGPVGFIKKSVINCSQYINKFLQKK